jgi:hypothetical protein
MRDAFRIWLAAFIAVAASFTFAVRSLINLIGPYDYPRAWRSAAQLAVRGLLYASAGALTFAAVLYALEVLFGR